MFGDIDKRLRELESLLFNLVRVGEVTAVFPDRGTARVRFQEKQGVVTAELHVPARTAHKVKDYAMPDVGEPVVCVFLPRGREVGFILCSFYTKAHTPPVTSGDNRHIAWDDGTWLEYDRATHTLTGHVEGDVQVDVSGDFTATVGGNREVTVSGNQDLETSGEKTDTVGGGYTITVTGECTVYAPVINLVKKGAAVTALDGVVTGKCVCALTGVPHIDKSSIVKASKE